MQQYLFKKEVLPGIVVHTIASGERIMLCRITLAKGAVLPVHSHPNEQASFVVSGSLRFTLNGEERLVTAGQGILFAPDEPHSAVALEDSVVSDVFSPPRRDYLSE